MKNKSVIGIVVVILIVAAVVAVIATGGKKKDDSMNGMNMNTTASNSSAGSNSANAVATDSVEIKNFAFSPATIKVKVGTTVTWTNKDSASHTVTSDSSDGPASPAIAQNGTYKFTFKKAGTFNYICTIHPDMKATVVVTN
jgi:plastocyanin